MLTYKGMNGFDKAKTHTQLSEEILVLSIGRWDMRIALCTLSRRAFRLFFQYAIQNGSGTGSADADTSSLTADSS
jgi:hypothetical protein